MKSYSIFVDILKPSSDMRKKIHEFRFIDLPVFNIVYNNVATLVILNVRERIYNDKINARV